jgi:hypothetical protein
MSCLGVHFALTDDDAQTLLRKATSADRLDVRMQFRQRGKLFLRVLAQSGFSRLGDQEVSSEAKLHLMSEPALLDHFILELRTLSEGSTEQAELMAISWN